MLFSEDPMWIELARDESLRGLGWCIYMYVCPKENAIYTTPTQQWHNNPSHGVSPTVSKTGGGGRI